MNEELIKNVKEIKMFYNVPYSRLADALGLKRNSFYNWVNGYYQLSPNNQRKLYKIIQDIRGA